MIFLERPKRSNKWLKIDLKNLDITIFVYGSNVRDVRVNVINTDAGMLYSIGIMIRIKNTFFRLNNVRVFTLGTEVRQPGSSKPGSSTKVILVELPVLNRLKLDSLPNNYSPYYSPYYSSYYSPY